MEFVKQAPIYLQIGDYIVENILRQRWSSGDRIPSIRELAMSVEVNPNTVTRTYAWLQEQGIINNQRGIGYFVADDGLEQTRALKTREFVEEEIPAFFNTMELLSMGLPDLEPYWDQYHRN